MNSDTPTGMQARTVHPGRHASLRAALEGIADRSSPRGRATLREFIGLLGHELRNPLAPLRNALYILDQADLDAPTARVLRMMERQVSTLLHVVDDLVDAAPQSDDPDDPEDRPQSSPRAAKEPRAADSASSLHVLVVDDNSDAAESLAELLRFHGHEVRLASNVREALEESAEHRFEVVVLDIGLPDKDGYSLAEALRASPGGHRYLLIALTGYAQEEDRRRSEQAGIDHHLTKPIEIARLLGLLAERAHSPRRER